MNTTLNNYKFKKFGNIKITTFDTSDTIIGQNSNYFENLVNEVQSELSKSHSKSEIEIITKSLISSPGVGFQYVTLINIEKYEVVENPLLDYQKLPTLIACSEGDMQNHNEFADNVNGELNVDTNARLISIIERWEDYKEEFATKEIDLFQVDLPINHFFLYLIQSNQIATLDHITEAYGIELRRLLEIKNHIDTLK